MTAVRTDTPFPLAPPLLHGRSRKVVAREPDPPALDTTRPLPASTPVPQALVHPRGIAAFLILSFSLAWVPLFISLARGLKADDLLGLQLALLPMALAPAAAACIVRKWITREGFADAGWAPGLAHWPCYLLAVLLLFLVVATNVGLSHALGTGEADFSLHRAFTALSAQQHTRAAATPSFTVLAPLLLLQSFLVTPLLWGEEFGWRGYLQPRVSPGRPLRAALYTGLIWGAWHYPLILVGYEYPGYPGLGLLVFPVSTILLSILFGWLRQKTGSIWAPSLAHAATNSIGGSLTFLLFWGGSHSILVRYLGVYGWLPLAAVCGCLLLTGQLSPSRRVART